MHFVSSKPTATLSVLVAWGGLTASCAEDGQFSASKRPNSGNLLEDSFASEANSGDDTSVAVTATLPSEHTPPATTSSEVINSSDDASDAPPATCGNGQLEEGEECDEASRNSNDTANACRRDCTRARCGDGVIDTGEDCDGSQDCSLDCHAVRCGNGNLEEGEECDPPVEGTCTDRCRLVFCGNGVIDEGESCEPPSAGRCSATCRVGTCGDQIVDPGEECDPPSAGVCDAQCKAIECGNSRIDSGEACDPPAPSACTAACQTIECGDGRVDPGEECEPRDDAEAACSAQCTVINSEAFTLYTFDSGIEPWVFYAASPTELQAGTRLGYDGQNGDVSPGVLRVEAPFDGGNQKVEFQVTLGQGLDLRGRVLKARVRLGSGLSSDQVNPGGIKLFAKAGASYGYASGAWTYLDGSSWMDVTLGGDAPILVPNEFDASDVRQIGFELRTFTETTQVSEAVIYIDSVVY